MRSLFERRLMYLLPIGLFVLVWIVFGQTLNHGFVNFDDDRYVYANDQIQKGLSWTNLLWVWGHDHANLWHPLTTLSHMADCQVFGLKPAGPHFINVLLHGVATILLFFVLLKMFGPVANEAGRISLLWRSAFVAAIFAIHPLRVESVAWISERKDVLSGVFFMLTLAAYLRYARRPNAASYVIMAALYFCGLLSKATLVAMPALLLLFDYWPLRRVSDLRNWWRFLPEKVPLLLLAAISSIMTIRAQQVTMVSLAQLSLVARLKNAVVSLVIYLRQMMWPRGLGIFYPHPHDHLPTTIVIASALVLLLITVAALILRQKCPYFFTGWFWFLIMIGPVLGLTQAGLQARADRFTYLPHIGLTIAVTWGICELARRGRFPRPALATLAGLIVTGFTLLAWRQTTYWRDSISIWQHTLAVTGENQTAEQNLAAAFWERGDKRQFAIHSREAAMIHWRVYLRDDPFDTHARDELGTLCVQAGRPGEGIEQWRKSLETQPNDGNALNDLAWVRATSPDPALRNGDEAVALADRASRLPGGDSPVVLRTLAAAEAEKGDFAKAIDVAERALLLAQGQGNDSFAATLRHEVELYRSSTAYREDNTQD